MASTMAVALPFLAPTDSWNYVDGRRDGDRRKK